MAEKKDAITEFFKSYAESDTQLGFRLADEQLNFGVDVISTGSWVLDDALGCGGLPCGRIIQYYGPPGCHAKGQKILMFDGTLKNVEDIVVGDTLMGPDSKPRNVLELKRGKDLMYKVVPNKGKDFIVNENHIMCFVKNNKIARRSIFRRKTKSSKLIPHFEYVEMSIKDYLKLSKSQKKSLYLYKANALNFTNNNTLKIDPYLFGLLLGDGTIKNDLSIHSMDNEILEFVENYCKNNNLTSSYRKRKDGIKCKEIGLRSNGKKFNNWLKNEIKILKANKKCDDKFIPHDYKVASYEDRLQILAGLIDTDGTVSNKYNFSFSSKSQQLANDVAFIAGSLGFYASVSEKYSSAHINHKDLYYEVYISGEVYKIPTKINRKKIDKEKIINHSNKLRYKFKLEKLDVDNFYGFSLDGDNKYLLDDFTVTHNSGKTAMTMLAIKEAQNKSKESKQVFIDAEQTFSPVWAELLGLDLSRIILVDEDLAVNGRRCFEMLLGVPKEDSKHILKGKSKDGLLDKIILKEIDINLIVLDSLGSIIPPGEDVSAVGKSNMALMARFLSTTFKKLSLEVAKANIPFIVINHKRDSLEMYGPSHTFMGGNSYSHFLSANIYFEPHGGREGLILNEKEERIGQNIRATIEKSKFGPHPRQCEFKLKFDEGIISECEEIAELALKYNVAVKTSSITIEYKENKYRGMGQFCEAVKASPEMLKDLKEKIIEVRDSKKEKTLTPSGTAVKIEEDDIEKVLSKSKKDKGK